MIPEFSIVSGVTPDYIKKLKWCIPTWIMKPQFAGRKLYLFHHGFENPEKELSWVGEYFETEFLEWSMPEYDGQRELMLSCFVLGTALSVKEDYFVKLDADTYFTDSQDVFAEDDFKHDLFSHSWGYTKPGWWIDKMDAFVCGKKHNGNKADKGRRGAKRIQSICCLHKTEFVRRCAKVAGSRLPIPSHDTYLWYMAENFKDCSWGSRKLYRNGVGHNSRFKGIRENICSSECAWNRKLNEELTKNVQVHITNSCNIGCNNCDRVCGLASDRAFLDSKQISRFINESIDSGHRYNRIDVIGGEPMLYPDLPGLYKELDRYREFHRRCRFRLTTNGTVNKDKIASIPDWIQVRNSAKDCGNKDYDFETFNVAPIDSGHKGSDAKSCSIPWRCGIALTHNGYFLCGAGSAVARVFGLNIGIQDLSKATPEAFEAQRKVLCQYCGHSRSIAKRDNNQQTSRSWVDALERYGKEKPLLRVYGAEEA